MNELQRSAQHLLHTPAAPEVLVDGFAELLTDTQDQLLAQVQRLGARTRSGQEARGEAEVVEAARLGVSACRERLAWGDAGVFESLRHRVRHAAGREGHVLLQPNARSTKVNRVQGRQRAGRVLLELLSRLENVLARQEA